MREIMTFQESSQRPGRVGGVQKECSTIVERRLVGLRTTWPVGNLRYKSHERKVCLSDSPRDFPAARSRKDQCRGLEPAFAVAVRYPGTQRRSRSIKSAPFDNESAWNFAPPPELH